jgi:uncharacterized protein YciI
MSIQLESYEMVLLRRTRGYDGFADEDRERIFGEHLAYVLGLVSSGRQLAAGPVRDSPATGELICGLGLFQQGSLEAVRELMDNDPGVRQGLYCYDVMTWQTPAGRISFRNP